jgi:hypothetical protein
MELYNSNITLVVAALAIAGVIYAFYVLNKEAKAKKLHVEEMLSVTLAERMELLLMGVVVAFCIGEGMTAASIHPAGEPHIAVASNIVHYGLILLSSVCGIGFIRSIAFLFIKMKAKYKVWRVIIVLVVGWAAIFIPIATVGLIAASAEAGPEYAIWKASMSPYNWLMLTEYDWQNLYIKFGKPPNYDPYLGLPIIVQRSILMVKGHILVIMLSGMLSAASPVRSGLLLAGLMRELEADSAEEKENKEEKEDAPDKEEDSSKSVANLKNLLTFMEYDSSKIQGIVDSCKRYLDKLHKDSPDDEVKYGVLIAGLETRRKNYLQKKKDKRGDPSLPKIKKELIRDIRGLFENPRDAKDAKKIGFEMTLKKSGGE